MIPTWLLIYVVFILTRDFVMMVIHAQFNKWEKAGERFGDILWMAPIFYFVFSNFNGGN